MISKGLFSFVLLLAFSFAFIGRSNGEEPNLKKQQTSDLSDIFFLCKNGKAVRWLRAYKLDNGKCHTIYSKEGYLQVISSGTYYTSCEGVLHNVRKNIEEGGYKCSRVEKYSYLDLE